MSLAASAPIDKHPAMQRLIFITLMLLAASCAAGEGLTLAPGWHETVVTEWEKVMPDMIVLSNDGNALFVTNENASDKHTPSLSRIDLASGEKKTLLFGLDRADGLKLDRVGNLWLGEEVTDGLILKIEAPNTLPTGLLFDRSRLIPAHKNIKVIANAGRMAHEGLALSKDGRYLYLADEWKKGCLFRLSLGNMKLEVFQEEKGWLTVTSPDQAREQAIMLHGRPFDRIEDMEQLPDGRILMAETGTGIILVLDDRGPAPSVSIYFRHDDLHHPDNLEWDSKREALWITDDDSPSLLWLLRDRTLIKVASHRFAEITGVESSADGTIWFNLQHNSSGPDMTLELTGSMEH